MPATVAALYGPQEPPWNIPGPLCFYFKNFPAFAHVVCPLYPEHPSSSSSPNLLLQICEGSVQHHFLQEAFSNAPPESRNPFLGSQGPLCHGTLYPVSSTFYLTSPLHWAMSSSSRNCRVHPIISSIHPGCVWGKVCTKGCWCLHQIFLWAPAFPSSCSLGGHAVLVPDLIWS